MTKLEELKRRKLQNTVALVFCSVAGSGGILGLADQGFKLKDAQEFKNKAHSAEYAPMYTAEDRKRADAAVTNLYIGIGGSFVIAGLGLVGGVVSALRREALENKIKHVKSFDV